MRRVKTLPKRKKTRLPGLDQMDLKYLRPLFNKLINKNMTVYQFRNYTKMRYYTQPDPQFVKWMHKTLEERDNIDAMV